MLFCCTFAPAKQNVKILGKRVVNTTLIDLFCHKDTDTSNQYVLFCDFSVPLGCLLFLFTI